MNRNFSLLYIRFVKRGLAMLLDLGILFIPARLIYLAAGKLFRTTPLFSLLIFLMFIFYFPLLHARTGQTIGKKVLGLIVVDNKNFQPVNTRSGRILTFLRFCYRDILGKLISHAIFGLGFLLALFNENGRALHDILAKTIVVEQAALPASSPSAEK